MNVIPSNINNKYKSALCKNYESPIGCSYKDKCQFAHGIEELRAASLANFGNPLEQLSSMNKMPNISNYKTIQCKNYQKEGVCKYGNVCTFAHGEVDTRSKNQNTSVLSSFSVGSEMGMNPYMSMMNPVVPQMPTMQPLVDYHQLPPDMQMLFYQAMIMTNQMLGIDTSQLLSTDYKKLGLNY